MMECYFSIAPIAARKIMQAPYPPAIPRQNNRIVARNLPRSDPSTKAAKIWAPVSNKPPIKIVFLGPNLE
jgi:hypothetical protein